MSRHRRIDIPQPGPRGCRAGCALKPVSLAVAAALFSLNAQWAAAAPTGGHVVAGAANIHKPDAQTTVIDQASARAVLNWQSFGIAAGESVIFRQPSPAALALNRVVGSDPSLIYGSLQANGQVFLVNPNGVLFGRGAAVDVGGLVASTLNISNQDFMAGRYAFSGGPGPGSVVNEGSIRAAEGGYVALIGSEVANRGTIVANAGSVGLGAGESVLLDFAGDGLMSLRVNAAAAGAKIEHGGLIQADGGRVILSARAKNALSATALNVEGIVRARGLGERNGEIFLDSGRSGVTSVSGTLDASDSSAGRKGGEIRVLGEYVGLFGNALLDASGAGGGGTVLIGGDYQGANPEIANAFRAYVGPDALIKADAITSGDGGKVIVWADDTTQFYGGISARGGVEGGNGGFAETSGKRLLNASGAVDLGAARGHGGTWLLDPNNLTISAAANNNVSGATPFQTTNDDAVLNAGTLGAALTGGAHVRVQTTNSGANTQAGTITVAAPVTATGGATLSLDAQSDILFTAAGQINSDGANALNVNLNAGSNAAFTTPGTNASVITMANGSGITTSGGNVTATARGNIQLAGIDTAAGSLTVNTSGAGAVTQASALSVGGTTSLTAGAANNVTLGAANDFGGAVSVASGNNVTLNDSNAIELGASTVGSLAVTAAGAISITGAISATGGGAVSLTATGASGSISESGAGAINTAGTLTTNSVTGQTLSGANDVGVLSATNTTSGNIVFAEATGVDLAGVATSGGNGNIEIVTTNGSITTSGAVSANGSGTITLTAGGAGSTATLSNPLSSGTGAVRVTADDLILTGSITTGGEVTLRPSGNASIGVGGAATFSVSDAEIDLIAAPGITFGSLANGLPLVIGAGEAVTAGAKNLTFLSGGGDIDVAANGVTTTGNVTFSNGARITNSGAGVVAANEVTLTAAAGIALKTNAVSLSANNTAVGDVGIVETDAVTLTGTNSSPGSYSVQAGGALTVSAPVSTGTGALALTGTTINLNANLTTDGGSVTLTGPTVVGGAGLFRIINTNAAGGGATAGNVQLGAVSGTSLLVNARGDDGAASVDDGTIVLGATTVSTLYAAGRTIQLGAGSDVDGLAVISTEAGAGFSYTDPNSLNLNSSAASAGISSIAGATTNDGPIALETGAGNLVASNPISAGSSSVALTAGGSGSLLDVSGVSGTGGVTLTADVMNIRNPGVNAGAVTATLRPFTAGRLIDLGSTTDVAANTLELSNAELGRITAGTLVIGRDDASAAGAISVSQPITAPAGWSTLSLRTGASVVDGNAAAGADITVSNLAIRAVSGIGAGDPLETAVTNFAYTNTGAGGVAIANAGALTLGNVDGITALNAGSGTLALSAASPMTIAADMIQAGSIDLTAGENAAPGPGDDLTVNTGVTVRSTAGDVTLRAGDQVTLAGTALVESTAAAGSVSLVAGFNDNDAVGAITGTGRASAVNVILDSLSGVGASGARFNTTAGTLAARSRASGGVFLSEADAVTLNAIGAVVNAGAASGYDLLAAGVISVAGPVVTAAAGPLALNGTAVNLGANLTSAGGTIAIAGPVTLTANNVTVDSTNGGTVPAGANVVLPGAIDADAAANNRTLTVNSGAGTTTFSGNVGAAQALADLDVTAGSIVFNAASAQTVAISAGGGSTATLTGPVTLAQSLAISGGPNSVSFAGPIDGAFALTVNTAGTTTFAGALGSATPLTALSTDAPGTTAINGGAVTTTGAQTYSDAVVLGADTTFTSTAGGDIAFAGSVSGGFGLTGITSGTTTFGGAAAGPSVLASLTTDAGGSTVVIGGGITTTGAQTYNDPVLLGSDTSLISTGAGDIRFNSALDGGFALTLNTAGATIFGMPVGGVTPLASLTTNAGGSTSMSGGSIVTTGAQTYNDAVTLAANTILASTGAGAVAFANTLDGGFALTVNTAGATSFAMPVGGASALAALSTDAGGTTTLNGGALTTTGAQTYGDAVTLGANTTVTSTGGGTLAFNSTLDGAFTLAANTAGTSAFGAAVGGTTALAALATDAGGSTALNGGAVTTTGTQTYNDAVTLGANALLASTGGGAITLGGAVDGAFALTANTSGATVFAAPVGGTTALAALTTDAPGTTALNGSAISTSGNQTYNDSVTLGANPTLTSTGGNVAFARTIDADAAANNRALVVNASAGTVTFSGNIGATQALADLDVTAGPTTIVFNGAPAQTVNVSAQGGNTATFNGPVVLATNLTVTSDGAADNNVTFAGTVNPDAFANNRTLTVTSGTGSTTFGGAMGNTQELGALTVSAGQLSLGGNVSVTGGGAVDLTNVPSIAFASGITIDTDRAGGAGAAGDVRFNGASFTNTALADANLAIDATADNGGAAGDVSLGTLGNANRLNRLAIAGDAVTFAGPVSARQVTVTANAIVTPTGQIQASQGFNGSTANANAAVLFQGLNGAGQFGTRDAPIAIDAPGLFVVIPNAPNTLPFVFLAGDPNRSPVYQFANDPMSRRVFYNGAAPDSPADRAAQGAITQQLRSLLDELAMAGFAKENIRRQLLQGIVLETGLARPAIDEFTGEGVTPPAGCEPQQKSVPSGTLAC